jgi:hypothetical protein
MIHVYTAVYSRTAWRAALLLQWSYAIVSKISLCENCSLLTSLPGIQPFKARLVGVSCLWLRREPIPILYKEHTSGSAITVLSFLLYPFTCMGYSYWLWNSAPITTSLHATFSIGASLWTMTILYKLYTKEPRGAEPFLIACSRSGGQEVPHLIWNPNSRYQRHMSYDRKITFPGSRQGVH